MCETRDRSHLVRADGIAAKAGDENSIAHNNRAGGPRAGELVRPTQVLFGTPLGGNWTFRRYRIAVGA